MKAVLNCSNKLVKNLEAELESSDDSVKIGLRLIEVAENMKEVYAPYLQNHPNISSSIKNVSLMRLLETIQSLNYNF